MNNFITGALGVFVVITLAPLLGVLFGAFAGWIVGWFFEATILGFFEQIGIKGLAMWQIGMSLGFIGGFFKSTCGK